ncbi:hypothetical protein WG66_006341 [Moniliophthora roreri]|nr:hypothetical protein WG66_006341 [Moniliophthora roreri]
MVTGCGIIGEHESELEVDGVNERWRPKAVDRVSFPLRRTARAIFCFSAKPQASGMTLELNTGAQGLSDTDTVVRPVGRDIFIRLPAFYVLQAN